MPSTISLKATGLSLSPNNLSIQEGGLSEASNIIIKRDDVIEARRGFKLYGESFGSVLDRTKQLAVYRDRILRHYSNIIQFQNETNNDGSVNFDNFAGNYSETQTGLRIKSIESNGNFYFTTSDGIKKISAANGGELTTGSNFITQSGGIKAVDIIARLDYTLGDQSGFLPEDSAVAYRIVWGIKDANNNLILGSPSQRAEIYNSLLTLLLGDFSATLGALDNINQSTSLINFGQYVSTYNLSPSASASQLRTNLIALTTQIDQDILYANSGSAPLTILNATDNGGNSYTINFTGTATNYFVQGSRIFLSNFTTTTGTINGQQTVQSVGASSITFTNSTAATGSDAVITTETIVSYEYRTLIQPSVPNIVPTNDDLIEIQTYLDSIQLRLQSEPNAVIPSALANTFIDTLDITTTSNVRLDVTIPQDVTADYFIQVYRSAVAQATGTTILGDLVPNDEMQQVYEAFPTAAELSARSMTIIDITPDAFRGANLYTNEATGEGAAQANDLPPFAKDINKFKNSVFYANTKTRHRKLLSLLGVANMIDDYNNSIIPKLMITNGTTTTTYSFVVGRKESTPITCVADIANSLNGKYILINSADDIRQYYIWYKTSGAAASDPAIAGRIGIRAEIITGETAINVAIKTKNTANTYINDFTATDNGAGIVTITNVDFGYTTDATAGTSGFTIGSIIQGRGESVTNKEILLSDSSSPSIAVDQTARSLVRIINKTTTSTVYAYYLSGTLSVPGQMFLESRTLNDVKFYLLTNNENTGASFNPNLSPSSPTITAISMANPTVITTSAPHGLVNGNSVVIINSNSTPTIDGLRAITYISSTTFSVAVNVTVAGTTGRFHKASTAEFSENDNKPNRIYYSKLMQPEAVPIVNYFDVGSEDKAILRIFPLRDSLFVFKEDGLYRISGESIPFVLSLFDSSAILLAPDSVSVANNVVYGWTTQGIVTVSESGVNIISRAIDTEILKLASSSYTNFKTATWGIGYESDNSYIVNTIKKTSDTIAKIAYRFSNLTNSWTTFDKTNTCGIINPVDDKLYLGAGDINYIEQERKDFTRYDYTDRELSSDLTSNSYFGTVIKLSNADDFEAGDVLVQNQTLTTFEYNMLLKKLDIDPGVTDSDYFSTLEASGGDDLRTSIVNLALKLDADTGVTDTDYFSDIDTKSGTITSITVANPTVITTTLSHGLITGRRILISGSNSVPSIDGTYEVTVISPTTFSIDFEVTTIGTTGSWNTLNTNFEDIKTCYNSIIDKLNNDITGVAFSNYRPIDNDTIQEAVILDVDNNTNELTLNLELPYIIGPLIVYKSITSTFTYSRNTLGDALSLKQAREATIMFDNKAFTSATMSFSTDLLPVFVDVPFNGDGNGIFGYITFGNGFFGGGSNAAPFRTYVPRNCQRCRFLIVKFTHNTAREQYAVNGTSITAEVAQSTRAYR